MLKNINLCNSLAIVTNRGTIMKYPKIYSIVKISSCLILFTGLFFTYSLPASAMTANNRSHHALRKNTSNGKTQPQKKSVYLLDWQENKLTTTAGVFLLNDGIKIIDRNNMKETFSLQQNKRHKSRKLHRVIIKKDGRKIVQITIK
jgi:hypothetical protein